MATGADPLHLTLVFVFQFGQLVPELSAEENVALPLLLGGMHREQALQQARAWLGRLDLSGMEQHRSGEMSGTGK